MRRISSLPRMEASGQPWAVIALAADDGWVPIGTVRDGCDMRTLGVLLRLLLDARRRGLSIRLVDVHPRLRELADFVGVADQLGIR